MVPPASLVYSPEMRAALFAIALLPMTTPAVGALCAPPPPVAAYLAKHPGWAILEISDLVADDQALWHQYHEGKCPGLAEAALDGSGKLSYALALVDRKNGNEQIVALKAEGNAFQPFTLQAPFHDIGSVVYRAPPGRSSDLETGREVRINHDSIVWEKMESASQQFYFSNKKFHKLQTSD
jgi:hypothetical protein